MSTSSNVLLTSDWMFPMIEEQLIKSHKVLQSSPYEAAFIAIAEGYELTSELLTTAQETEFAALAKLLEVMTMSMANQQLSLSNIQICLEASKQLLLQLTTYMHTKHAEISEVARYSARLQEILQTNDIAFDPSSLAAERSDDNQLAVLDLDSDNELLFDDNSDIDSISATNLSDTNSVVNTKSNTTINFNSDVNMASMPVIETANNPMSRPKTQSANFDNSSQEVQAQVSILNQALQAVDLPVDDHDIDAEIQEIFIEEVESVLEEISDLFDRAQSEPDQTSMLDAIKEIRRGFHTLKGSGRMAGANSTAELAWAIESLLNRILDNTVELTKGIEQLVADVITSYPQLIDIYQQRRTYPDKIKQWIACANIYIKGQQNYGDSQHTFDYCDISDLIQEASSTTQQSGTDEFAAPVLSNPDIVTNKDDLINTILNANETLKVATKSQPIESYQVLDDDLKQLFTKEASELLNEIQNALIYASNQEQASVDDNMVRAFHTLHGAASSQSLTAISEISATIEQSLEQLQRHDLPLCTLQIQAIAHSVELIRHYISQHLGHDLSNQAQTEMQILHQAFDSTYYQHENQESLLNINDLIDDDISDLLNAQWELEATFTHGSEGEITTYADKIHQQCQVLLTRVESVQKFTTVLNAIDTVYQLIQQIPALAKTVEVQDALITGHNQVTELMDALAGSMKPKIDSAVIDKLEQIASDNVSGTDSIADESISPPATTALEALKIEQVSADAELLEIFYEEAQEIDDNISYQFELWQSNIENLEPLRSLQRHLHTIKGGARMAEIESVAELTHEVETIYEQIVDGRIQPNENWVQLLQVVQDTLANQIQLLVTQGYSFYVPQLVDELRRLAKTRDLSEDQVQRVIASQTSASVEQMPQALNSELTSESPENTELLELSHDESGERDVPSKDLATSIEEVFISQQYGSVELEFEQLKSDSWAGEKPDNEIVSVFLEEAKEVLSRINQEFDSLWKYTEDRHLDETQESEVLAILKSLVRELHKLKGGSRMIYANAAGDVIANLETVYKVYFRNIKEIVNASHVLQLAHQWLSQAVSLIDQGINPPAAEVLNAQLIALAQQPDQEPTQDKDTSLNKALQVIKRHEAWRELQLDRVDISKMPPYLAEDVKADEKSSASNEVIRVPADTMESMINLSGESAVHRSRIELSISSVDKTINEMESTVQRLANQLRRMEVELESQIRSQINDKYLQAKTDFDPLEMDQYSIFNQLSKSLSESASDLFDIKTTLRDKTRDTENLLLHLAQSQSDLQDGLMTSRMMPFSHLSTRLYRIVRQTSNEIGKSVELVLINEHDEVDRTILDKITSPIEHMLRNAIDHGIELPEERAQSGKSKTGRVELAIEREGSEVIIRLSDDGKGIDTELVRRKAVSHGLINEDDTSISDSEVIQYIFHPGLSTAGNLTQLSGRGVGMDVVISEVRQLGGTISVQSKVGEGAQFTIRLPLTMAITDALVVRVGSQNFAIPLIQVERVERIGAQSLLNFYQSNDKEFKILGEDYRLRYLNELLSGTPPKELSKNRESSVPVVILKNQTGQNLALQVDEVVGSNIELVVKPLKAPLANVKGFSAATITADGSVMLILDTLNLMRNLPYITKAAEQIEAKEVVKRTVPQILIVDDSVTVRKVTSRLLERQGYKTVVARDGVEALELLETLTPDLMLLDIEMPRMDGFEVATHIRNNPVLASLPIIMITSRTGDKHRQRALDIGVNDYMGKPFQEVHLINTIQNLIDQRYGVVGG